MTNRTRAAAGTSTGMYVRRIPLLEKRYLETEALRRKHEGDESATLSDLVTEALREWRLRIESGRHRAQAAETVPTLE